MAKKISSNDLFEGDVFASIKQSAEETIAKLQAMNSELIEMAKLTKSGIKGAKTDSSKGIQEFNKFTNEANQLQREKIELEKQEASLRKMVAQAENEELKTKKALNAEAEKEAKAKEKALKAQKDQESAYKQLAANTRDLKNQSKELAAQMLVLENAGKKNSKEYRQLASEYKNVTAAAQKGDQALKKIDSTVGDNFRNVGNYNGAINKLRSGLGELGLAFGIGSVVTSAGQTIVEFDQKIADLISITGAGGSDLEFFKAQAIELGKSVQGGASEVIEAYKLIGSAKPELLANAQALDSVTQSAITLSQASGMTLPEAATALTDAMNQFGAPAEDAARFIDSLANGALFGSAEIPQVTDALLKFGAVANTANVSLEESTGLIEALAEKGLKGAEAGTALRNVMLKLSAPDALPKEAKDRLEALGISMSDLSDTSKPFSKRLDALKPLLKDNAALVKVFGTENAVAATNLINNTGRIEELTAQMHTQGTASKQAEDRTKTLSFAFNELKETFKGYILGLNSSSGASSHFVDAIKFLSKNLTTILDVIVLGIKYFGIWKVATYGQIIANKLLASSTEKTMTSIGDGFKKIGEFLKTNAISIFVTAMISGFMKIKSTLNELNAPFERINDLNDNLASISQRSSEKLGEEKAQLQLLVGQIKSHNAGSEERGKLLQQLNDKYGVHLENIKDETKANQLLDQTQRQIIANMKSQILLQGRQEAYVEIIKAVQAAEDDYAKAISSNRAKINKLSDKEVNAWIERLAGATSYGDKLRQLSIAEKRRYLIEDNLSSEQLNKKLALEELQKKELEFEKKLQNQMNANTQSVSQNSVSVDTNTGSTDDNSDSKKKLKTEIDSVNESLSRQNELLAQVDEISAKNTILDKQKEIDIALSNMIAKAKETGEIFTGEQGTPEQFGEQFTDIEKLLNEKYDIEIEAIKNQQKEKLKLIEQGYTEESRKEREELIKKRDELLAQEGITTEAKEKIEESYQKELEQIRMNDLQRNADFELEKIIIADETKTKITQIEKQKSDEINDINDQLINAQIEHANKSNEIIAKERQYTKEELQKMMEDRNKWAQIVADYFIEQSNRKIKQIEKEQAAAQSQFEYYKQLAAQGNIDAKESLAEQQRIIDEANMKKERELKRQQRIKLAEAVYSTYNAKVAAGSENPLLETIKDATLLQQFIQSLPTFYDGTEDTGKNGNGVDGKGGFHAILHPNERVIPKSLNDQIGSMSNEALAKLAMEYQNGKVLRSDSQLGSAYETAILAGKIDELNNTIRNKPETNIELGEITQSVMNIVKSSKQGNTVVYNRYRIRS